MISGALPGGERYGRWLAGAKNSRSAKADASRTATADHFNQAVTAAAQCMYGITHAVDTVRLPVVAGATFIAVTPIILIAGE